MLTITLNYHTKIVADYVELFKHYCGEEKVHLYLPDIALPKGGHLHLDVKNNFVENIYLGIEKIGNEDNRCVREYLPVFEYSTRLLRYKVNISGINSCSQAMMGAAVLFIDEKKRKIIRDATTAVLNDADGQYADLSFRQYWKDIAEAAVQDEPRSAV